MSDRSQAQTITFANIAAGGVVRNLDPDSLAPPNESGVFSPTFLSLAKNVNLFEGEVLIRDGSVAFSTVRGSNTINGIFRASFDPGRRQLVAGYAGNALAGTGAVEVFDEKTGSNTWIVITPSAGTGSPVPLQPWQFAMVPRASDTPANAMMFGNQGTSCYLWDGTMLANSAVELDQVNFPGSPSGAKTFVSFLSRAMALNINDENGNRKESRIAFSIVGDSNNWSALGSGTLDLDDDPWAIQAALVMGGRLVVLKGGPEGGAIYVLTPTGAATSPMRVDAINPGTDVGILIPRSLTPLGPGVAFFLSHDAAYLYDGVRALRPFAQGVARDIASRVNINALDSGFAYYNRNYRQVELHVAVGSSTTPNEVWTFDVRNLRAWGPDTLGTAYYSADTWTPQGVLTWDTWGQATSRTWDTLLVEDAGAQYHQWDLAKGDYGTETIVYGAADGIVYKRTPGLVDDPGPANIDVQIDLPPITPAMWLRNPKTGKRYRADDMFVLRSLTLRHRSTTQWTPVVKVKIDGSAAVNVSDGSAATAATTHLHSITYYPDDTVVGPGVSFEPQIFNTAGGKCNFKDIQCEFTYAGSARHD